MLHKIKNAFMYIPNRIIQIKLKPTNFCQNLNVTSVHLREFYTKNYNNLSKKSFSLSPSFPIQVSPQLPTGVQGVQMLHHP